MQNSTRKAIPSRDSFIDTRTRSELFTRQKYDYDAITLLACVERVRIPGTEKIATLKREFVAMAIMIL